MAVEASRAARRAAPEAGHRVAVVRHGVAAIPRQDERDRYPRRPAPVGGVRLVRPDRVRAGRDGGAAGGGRPTRTGAGGRGGRSHRVGRWPRRGLLRRRCGGDRDRRRDGRLRRGRAGRVGLVDRRVRRSLAPPERRAFPGVGGAVRGGAVRRHRQGRARPTCSSRPEPVPTTWTISSSPGRTAAPAARWRSARGSRAIGWSTTSARSSATRARPTPSCSCLPRSERAEPDQTIVLLGAGRRRRGAHGADDAGSRASVLPAARWPASSEAARRSPTGGTWPGGGCCRSSPHGGRSRPGRPRPRRAGPCRGSSGSRVRGRLTAPSICRPCPTMRCTSPWRTSEGR